MRFRAEPSLSCRISLYNRLAGDNTAGESDWVAASQSPRPFSLQRTSAIGYGLVTEEASMSDNI